MRDIGIPVKMPKKACTDSLCPFHGRLPVRGKILGGVVVSTKMKGTVVVEREYYHYDPKYKRYERRRSSIPAHNPSCIEVREGDFVKIGECRPLSKTVSFVIIEKLER